MDNEKEPDEKEPDEPERFEIEAGPLIEAKYQTHTMTAGGEYRDGPD